MNAPAPSVGFDRLELAPTVLQAVQGLGYETPTHIQSQCIPHLLAGKDLLGQAQTGTGKTAAFALPLLSRIDLNGNGPQVLVLTPTRELALQVAEAFQSYAHHMKGFHVLPIYGGQSYSIQIKLLRRGAHVVVGTPGRVMDHLRRGTLVLDRIATLVLDEADEMLNMGFAEDIEWIFDQAPRERQVALFSATMPAGIRRVAEKHLRDPVGIKIEAQSETVDTIDQHHCVVTRHHKLDTLTRVLEVEAFDAMLVFVRTKNGTEELAEKLVAHGFSAEALNGDMNQQQRERTVERLKSGRLDIVVATDVAARGLDVERISHVVNYDIPNDPESYVHRIGRTGRAGRKGKALLFVQPRERHLLRDIERNIRRQIPVLVPPSADELTEHRIGQFTQRLHEALAGEDLDFFYELVSRIAREQELEMLDIAAALTFLAQQERPLSVAPSDVDRAPPPRNREERSGRRRDGARDGDVSWVSYRLSVGHRDGAGPKQIVGAIANEAGLEGRYIGRIDIRDDFSVVDLPEGMPSELQAHLRDVIVCGKRLNLKPMARSAKDKEQTRRAPQNKPRNDPHGQKSGRPNAGKKPHRGKR